MLGLWNAGSHIQVSEYAMAETVIQNQTPTEAVCGSALLCCITRLHLSLGSKPQRVRSTQTQDSSMSWIAMVSLSATEFFALIET